MSDIFYTTALLNDPRVSSGPLKGYIDIGLAEKGLKGCLHESVGVYATEQEAKEDVRIGYRSPGAICLVKVTVEAVPIESFEGVGMSKTVLAETKGSRQ